MSEDSGNWWTPSEFGAGFHVPFKYDLGGRAIDISHLGMVDV